MAFFRFFDELNDFLPEGQKYSTFEHRVDGSQTIKHLVEAIGVPHTEIHRILVNDHPVDFRYRAQDGDLIEVWPKNRSYNQDEFQLEGISGENHRFILDNHLGRLASYLRLLGFDSFYQNDYQDEELARLASYENRILLTRDRRLLMRSLVQQGYFVRQLQPRGQLLEILDRFDLYGSIHPFKRCARCNGLLKPVPKEEILPRLEPLTIEYYDDFHICQGCGQVYWKGSHYERFQQFIDQVLQGKVSGQG